MLYSVVLAMQSSLCVCVSVRMPWAQSCLTPCDPGDCGLLGSFVQHIFQTRLLSGLSFPTPGDLPDPGTEPKSLVSPALAGGFFNHCATWEAHIRRQLHSCVF